MQVPYEDFPLDAVETLIGLSVDATVGILRDTTGADLVQLVDDFDDATCGAG